MFAPQRNNLTIAGQVVLAVVLTLVTAGAVATQPVSSTPTSKPWWKQEKIRFFWGQWGHLEDAKAPWEQTMANLARAGATVFVDHARWEGWMETDHYNLDRARLAHKYGIRYFGLLNVAGLHAFAAQMQAPLAVDERGEYPGGAHTPCPLYRPLYEQWFLKPMLEAAQSGLVDGFHMDWEPYGGRGEAGVCYCDDCFAAFLTRKHLQVNEQVPKEQRYQWLEKRGLVDEYKQVFAERRTEMFADFARRIHQAKPDFVFSGYDIGDCPLTRGLHTPQVPFFVVDPRHYFEDHTRPWWESHQDHFHKLGFLRIAGSWDNSFFGGQPESDVSVSQWMYNAAINSDGCWLWFEEELTPDAWRSFWIANRRIQATEAKVGQFLLDGKQDIHFVTPVEWSGSPELAREIIQRAYHLRGEHLIHLHNVDTHRPIRLRLRFPRLRAESRWTVTDPLVDLTYVHNGGKVIWTGRELRDGIGLCLEKRSELFVKLSPAQSAVVARPVATIASDESRPMPNHAEAAASAAGPKAVPRLYIMKNSIYGQQLDTLAQSATEVLTLPKDGWLFKPDKDDNGVNEQWYLPNASTSDWQPIQIEGFWGDLVGAGWYRREVDFPKLPAGKNVYLRFNGVDEELVMWIDGHYAGDYNRGPEGWDQPFAINVTGKITEGKHQLVMRVYNSYAAGGIWKPVTLLVSAVKVAGNSSVETGTGATAGPAVGRLVYTVTEQLGYRGSQGGWAIGNAIHVIAPDGTNHRRLRQLKGYLWSPVASPDGRRIAFTHYANGRGQIYVMNSDGTGAVNVSNNRFCDRSPVWSPDGSKLAFVSDRDGDWEIFVMNADGSEQRQLTHSPGTDQAPAWSPDGQRLAFETNRDGDMDIYVMNANGLGQRPVIQRPGDQREPAWSADGRRLACVGVGRWAEELLVAEVDSGEVRQAMMMPWIGDLSWSPDGQRLAGAFRGPQEQASAGIFVIDPDTSEGQLSHGADSRKLVMAEALSPYSSGVRGRSPEPTWYSSGSASPAWVVKTFGGVCWSPDGRHVAFSSDMADDGYFSVYVVSAAGGEALRLEDTASVWPQQISWSAR